MSKRCIRFYASLANAALASAHRSLSKLANAAFASAHRQF
jgi:hypothetical protein